MLKINALTMRLYRKLKILVLEASFFLRDKSTNIYVGIFFYTELQNILFYTQLHWWGIHYLQYSTYLIILSCRAYMMCICDNSFEYII